MDILVNHVQEIQPICRSVVKTGSVMMEFMEQESVFAKIQILILFTFVSMSKKSKNIIKRKSKVNSALFSYWLLHSYVSSFYTLTTELKLLKSSLNRLQPFYLESSSDVFWNTIMIQQGFFQLFNLSLTLLWCWWFLQSCFQQVSVVMPQCSFETSLWLTLLLLYQQSLLESYLQWYFTMVLFRPIFLLTF